jgi:GntR family transcriptional regulator
MANPLYRQIAEDLRRQIESGELQPSEQLKTEIELREFYNASRNTVRDAIKWLTMLGLVETRPGQGTFVVPRVNPFVTRLSDDPETGDTSELDVYIPKVPSPGRRLEVSEPRVEIERANSKLAARLGLAEGQPVISRHQQLSIDSVPWALQTTFYPMEFVTRGALQLIETVNLKEGAITYLAEAIGVTQTGWRDMITARTPSDAETTFFRLQDRRQVPVFEIQRTGFDETGCPMRLAITVFPADRNRFIYENGEAPALPDLQQALLAEPSGSLIHVRGDANEEDNDY